MILSELTTKLGFAVDTHGLESVHEKLEGINRSVKFLAAAEIGHMLYELAERFAGMGEHLESTAIAAGLTTTELQKLQFAASQNAVSGDALASGLARLTRTLYSAQKGGKQARAIFEQLGIGPEQLAQFKNSSEALAAIQDAMRGVTDANQRQAITMQLFGRGGSGMIKFLTVGSEKTKALGESAQQMGAVVSEDGVKALAEFEDAASGLGQVIKSFMATVASTLAPAFVEMIHMIEGSWATAMPTMRETIKAFGLKAAFWLGFVSEGFRLLFKLVVGFASDHMGLLTFIAKWAPATMIAVSAFDLLVEGLGKIVRGWRRVEGWSKKGWSALLWGAGKLQAFTTGTLSVFADLMGIFSPGLALKIRAVGLALAGLTPLQFTLVVAGLAALVVAAHDLYEYFFKDVPFDQLWIGKLVKRLEPLTAKLGGMARAIGEFFGIGAKSPEQSTAPLTPEEAGAPYLRGPMSSAADLPSLFGGARQMGMKFRPDDPVNSAPVKTSIMLNAPISVTVPPGMSTPDSIRVVREGVHATLLEMLGDAHGHLQPAAAR